MDFVQACPWSGRRGDGVSRERPKIGAREVGEVGARAAGEVGERGA